MGLGRRRERGTRRIRTSAGVALAVATALTLATPSPLSAHKLSEEGPARRHIKRRGLSQLGTRYTYGGESPSTGFDCSGFTYWVFKDHGATLPRRSIDQWGTRKRDGYRRIWKRSRLRKGDLVFFKTSSATVGHAGIYIGNRRFVHSTPSSGGVRRDLMRTDYWRSNYVGAVRVPALRAGS